VTVPRPLHALQVFLEGARVLLGRVHFFHENSKAYCLGESDAASVGGRHVTTSENSVHLVGEPVDIAYSTVFRKLRRLKEF